MRHIGILGGALLLAACTAPAEHEAAADLESDEAPLAGIACPQGASAEVCSGDGTVWTGLLRASRSGTRATELAQPFTVTREGRPGRLRLMLRLMRPLAQGETAHLRVAVREVVGGVVPTAASSDIARAALPLTGITRVRAATYDLPLASTTPAAEQRLDPLKSYAFVLTVDAPSASDATVGVASLVSASSTAAARRSLVDSGSGFPDMAFTAGTDVVAFALTLDDGVDVDECALGSDNCDANATCANTPGSFTCTCNAGWSGDGTSCGDVDECTANLDDCDANAACTNTAGAFTCACNRSWLGDGRTCALTTSCAALHTAGGLTTGADVYWIDVDGAGPETPFTVYCHDPAIAGGGWTLLVPGSALVPAGYDPAHAYWKGDAGVTGTLTFNGRTVDRAHLQQAMRVLPFKTIWFDSQWPFALDSSNPATSFRAKNVARTGWVANTAGLTACPSGAGWDRVITGSYTRTRSLLGCNYGAAGYGDYTVTGISTLAENTNSTGCGSNCLGGGGCSDVASMPLPCGSWQAVATGSHRGIYTATGAVWVR